MNLERRAYNVELRAEPDSNSITGYAAVFDSLSEDLGGFREIIRPGAFARSLEESPDVFAFYQHDSSKVLGRTTAGTLSVSEDDHGLRFEITPPDGPTGRDALEAVRRGDVTSMSFGFLVEQDRMLKQPDGTVLRELLDIHLLEVSPVTFPAYQATSAEVRSDLQARIEELHDEPAQHPCHRDIDADLALLELDLALLEAKPL